MSGLGRIGRIVWMLLGYGAAFSYIALVALPAATGGVPHQVFTILAGIIAADLTLQKVNREFRSLFRGQSAGKE